jgi:hypothetical protein
MAFSLLADNNDITSEKGMMMGQLQYGWIMPGIKSVSLFRNLLIR